MDQRELALLASIKLEGEWVPENLVTMCESKADAVVLCWLMRRVKYSVSHAAAELGIPTSHLSNILSKKKYLPNIDVAFQRLCGNWAIRQWEDMTSGLVTLRDSPEQRELRRLTAENERLRAAA